MIVSQTVKIRVNNKNIDHYINQSLDVIYGGVYEMDIKFLPRYSKYKITKKGINSSKSFLKEEDYINKKTQS